MKRVALFIPLAIFLGVAGFLFKGLYLDPSELDSALVGKTMPAFELETLENPNAKITHEDLKGKVYLVNIWATWCPSCKYEHPFLNQLRRNNIIDIYGVNYRDERGLAIQYLAQSGDPYTRNIFDPEGTLAFDMGVYGAPETFVVDHNGVVRHRFAGVLEPGVWEKDFAPLIQKIRAEAVKEQRS